MRYVFVVLSLFLTHLNAETLRYVDSSKRSNIQYFFELSRQSELTKLELFEVQAGKLQERVLSKSFSTTSDAYAFINSYKLEHSLKEEFNFLNIDFVSTELNENQFIWKAKHDWNQQWEIAYSLWVKENFTKEFFIKYKISTDCADVAFALRWIFSRINNLPAANSLAATGVLFNNESMKKEWASLPTHEVWHKDKRFLSALNYMLNNTYTKSLAKDTYPIKIAKDSFNIGTIQLLGSHTLVLAQVNDDNTSIPFVMLSSTVPAKVRVLSESFISNTSELNPKDGGIIKFRWPVKEGTKFHLVAKDKMFDYSMEQYSKEFINETGDFVLSVIKRISPNFSFESLVVNFANSLTSQVKARIEVVNDGYKYCLENSCEENTQGYEEWSTPSRDLRILQSYYDIRMIIFSVANGLSSQKYIELLDNKLKENKINILENEFSILEIIRKITNNWLSYHPKDAPEERWALTSKNVENYINRSYERYVQARQIKVSRAGDCRLIAKDCSIGSNAWKIYNTFEIDQKLKSVYMAYVTLCHNETNYKCQFENMDQIYRVPFFISNPIYSEEIRWSKNIKRNQVIIFPYPSYCQIISDEVAICNQNKLYNFKENIFIELNQDFNLITRVEKTNIIIAATNDAFYQLDLNGKEQLLVTMKNNYFTFYNDGILRLTVNGLVVLTGKNEENLYYHSYFKVDNGQLTYLAESKNHSDITLKFLEGTVEYDSILKESYYLDFITGSRSKIAAGNEIISYQTYNVEGSQDIIAGFSFVSDGARQFFDIRSKKNITLGKNLSLNTLLFSSESGYAGITYLNNQKFFSRFTFDFKHIESFKLNDNGNYYSSALDQKHFIITESYSPNKANTEFYIYDGSVLTKILNPIPNTRVIDHKNSWIIFEPIDSSSKIYYLFNWKTKAIEKFNANFLQMSNPVFGNKLILVKSNVYEDEALGTSFLHESFTLDTDDKIQILYTVTNSLNYSSYSNSADVLESKEVYPISVGDSLSLLYIPNM